MEKFLFFDPIETSPGVFDREYNAEEFVRYFATLVNTGLMQGFGNDLEVTATGTDMNSEIDTGTMFIEGRYYENTEPLALTHDVESVGNNRIDRVVIRLDLRTESRFVKAFIKKGTPASSPVAPSLQRDSEIYELSLAQIYITGGQSFIEQSDITDERGEEGVCPYASSNILPSIGQEEFDNLESEFIKHKAENAKQAHGESLELLSEVVLSAPTTELDFIIPEGYKRIKVFATTKNTTTSATHFLLRFNDDLEENYFYWFNTGSTDKVDNTDSIRIGFSAVESESNNGFGIVEFEFPLMLATSKKPLRGTGTCETATFARPLTFGVWKNEIDIINKISMFSSSDFGEGSRFVFMGVK